MLPLWHVTYPSCYNVLNTGPSCHKYPELKKPKLNASLNVPQYKFHRGTLFPVTVAWQMAPKLYKMHLITWTYGLLTSLTKINLFNHQFNAKDTLTFSKRHKINQNKVVWPNVINSFDGFLVEIFNRSLQKFQSKYLFKDKNTTGHFTKSMDANS